MTAGSGLKRRTPTRACLYVSLTLLAYATQKEQTWPVEKTHGDYILRDSALKKGALIAEVGCPGVCRYIDDLVVVWKVHEKAPAASAPSESLPPAEEYRTDLPAYLTDAHSSESANSTGTQTFQGKV